MFSKLAVVFVSTLALASQVSASQCNTGSLTCCNDVKEASDPSVARLLSLLGIAAQGVTGQVGLTCNPVSVIGVGGNNCAAQPVCCTNNNFNGAVALGCTPVNANV